MLIQVVHNESGMNIKVLERQRNFIGKIFVFPSEGEDLPTWMIENIQSFFKSSQMTLQRPEPKMFGKGKKMGLVLHVY